MENKIKKILNSKLFYFIIFSILLFISIYNKDIMFGSGDAYETWAVVKSFFTGKYYASYVMYKGLYAFIPEFLSYRFGLLFGVSEFLLIKIFKSLMFSYLIVYGFTGLIKNIFKFEAKHWQIVLFGIFAIIYEFPCFSLLSVDLISCFLFVLLANTYFYVTNKFKNYRLVLFGFLAGITSCLSGQYSVSVYILILMMIIYLIKNYHKSFKKLSLLLVVLFGSFLLCKLPNVLFEHNVVDELRANGEWIPKGSSWIISGLSNNMLMVNYPVSIHDNLGLAVVKDSYEPYYDDIMNGNLPLTPDYYFKLVIKYPIPFLVCWIERFVLGIVNDPVNSFPNISLVNKSIYLTVAFYAICIYILWYFITKYLKKFKNLVSTPALLFYSFLFSALVPSFGHVENRYFISFRLMIMSLFLLSPLLLNFFKKLINRKINFSKVNPNVLSCIMFVLICLTFYLTFYQIGGVNSSYIESFFR